MKRKYSVCTAQETLRLDYKIGQLLLHRKIIAVCSEIQKVAEINCEQNVDFFW
jgi:hypothetical protein